MNDWLEKTNKSHFKFNLLGRAWRRGWWALETGSQTVYGVSLIASCSFIKIYSINMWCALCYAIGLPFPQLVSDQKKPLVLTLPFPLLDTLDCPDLHRPVNKYCAQKSVKDLSTELCISLFFLLFLWTHDIMTETKNRLWKLSDLIALSASFPSSLPFLCDVSHSGV